MISLMAHFGNQDCLIKKIAQGNLFAEDCKAKALSYVMEINANCLGTIHILRKHLYSTKLNLNSNFLRELVFFCQNKGISFSTLHFDKIFML